MALMHIPLLCSLKKGVNPFKIATGMLRDLGPLVSRYERMSSLDFKDLEFAYYSLLLRITGT
jgi:hypothetical protein